MYRGSPAVGFPEEVEEGLARPFLPSRSSRILRSSTASLNASNEPYLSSATSSTLLFSSSAVSYVLRSRTIRHCDPGPPGTMVFPVEKGEGVRPVNSGFSSRELILGALAEQFSSSINHNNHDNDENSLPFPGWACH